ncbi:MAG: carboxypeptidase-like regulatory domain-containing protein, partial [Sphingobacterium sp.]
MQTKSIHYAFSLLLFLGVSFSLNANAQQREITGRVRDAQNNEILAGATVAVEGRQSQTSTDQSGNFQIALAGPDETLIISYVGYQSERVRPDTDHLEVLLQPASKDMEEIVVVAYGTSRRSSITGSVSTINNEQIENRQVASLSKALEGQVPGLQSVSSSGQPGTDAGIRIR